MQMHAQKDARSAHTLIAQIVMMKEEAPIRRHPISLREKHHRDRATDITDVRVLYAHI